MKSPAFQHYVGDFLSHPIVALMTAQEVGAYWLLINYAWQLGELPNDLEELSIYARLPVETFEPMWTRRIQRCFQLMGNVWIHPHLEEEKIKHQNISKVRQKASEARWDKQKPTKPDANALQMESSSSSSSTSLSSKEKEEIIISSKKKNGTRIPNDFHPSDEMLAWAKEKAPTLDLSARILEFKNYWEAKSGKDATKLDWDKTFQNRILQILEYQSNKPVTNGVNGNGSLQKHHGSGSTGNGQKPKTNFEISQSRNYDWGEDLDPIAVFGEKT